MLAAWREATVAVKDAPITPSRKGSAFGPQVLGYLVILFSSETVSAHATENCVQLFYSDARPQARPQLLVRAHDTPIIT